MRDFDVKLINLLIIIVLALCIGINPTHELVIPALMLIVADAIILTFGN